MKIQSDHHIRDNISSRDKIKEIDQSNVLGSIESLADQIKHAWNDVKKIKVNLKRKPKNVVVAGMGGSALGSDVIKHLYKDQLDVPFEVINSYTLPNYVDENTLCLISSYSGQTEETLSCFNDALDKKAQIIVITAGGKLKEKAKQHDLPVYEIDAKFNPSNQPRMAIGYSIIGSLGLFNKAGIIKITDREIEEVQISVIRTLEKSSIEIPAESNPAKMLAFQFIDKRPIFVASEFLIGAAHTSTNQLNENAKIYADYKIIPEINHHLLESLRFPKNNDHSHIFIFLQSKLYRDRNLTRFDLTKEVLNKYHIESTTVNLTGESKINQIFETITLMSFTTFYLCMLEEVDPAEIPYVDWFKQKLK